MKDTNAIDQERQRRGAALAAEMREVLEPRTAAETAAAFVAGMPDVMSFPPLPPSPAEVGDLTLQTREHVQALGWGNREQLYTASQVRAVMSECAAMAAARERERGLNELRNAVRQLAALNAWYHFGECRAWTAGPILSPLEADELARRVLRA